MRLVNATPALRMPRASVITFRLASHPFHRC